MKSQEPNYITPNYITSSPLFSQLRLQVIDNSTASLNSLGQLSPASLAYLGDAVFELYIRSRYLLPPQKMSEYHDQVVAKVRAESQAAYLQTLEPYLTESEQDIIRRGRNAATGKPRRLAAKIYQQASSLETLIGYLYLQNPQRLHQLLELLPL